MATFQDDQLNGNGREISHEKQTFSHVSRFAPKPFHRFPIFQPRTTPSSYTYICICTYVYIYIHTRTHTRAYTFHFPREKKCFAGKFFLRQTIATTLVPRAKRITTSEFVRSSFFRVIGRFLPRT